MQFFLPWCNSPHWSMASPLLRINDHTQRRSTVGRTPLDEWSARHRDLYLTTHNTHNRHTSMFPVGLEPTIPEMEGSQTHALDRVATGIGKNSIREQTPNGSCDVGKNTWANLFAVASLGAWCCIHHISELTLLSPRFLLQTSSLQAVPERSSQTRTVIYHV